MSAHSHPLDPRLAAMRALVLERLARHPRCAEAKGPLRWLPAALAVQRRYLELNRPCEVAWLTFDLDYPALQAMYAWEEAGLPEPNLAAATILDGHTLGGVHLSWALARPVLRGRNARPQPQRYLQAVRTAMTRALGAGPGLCRHAHQEPLAPVLARGLLHR